jgi:two-component system, sensor histidine kinase PdtaS
MEDKPRKSGLGLLGNLPWSTHFCQFYQTKGDLADIIVPFLRAGLEDNDACVWVASEALTTQEALAYMRMDIPHLDNYLFLRATGGLSLYRMVHQGRGVQSSTRAYKLD